jgi:hypothetical protein
MAQAGRQHYNKGRALGWGARVLLSGIIRPIASTHWRRFAASARCSDVAICALGVIASPAGIHLLMRFRRMVKWPWPMVCRLSLSPA